MGWIILGVIIAAVIFFKYCEGIGEEMEIYQNKDPEWNPPWPDTPSIPSDTNKWPPKKRCCCGNCKYLYSGTKTEYWYDDSELKGKTEVTRYYNFCAMTGMSLQELRYSPNMVIECHFYQDKGRK